MKNFLRFESNNHLQNGKIKVHKFYNSYFAEQLTEKEFFKIFKTNKNLKSLVFNEFD